MRKQRHASPKASEYPRWLRDGGERQGAAAQAPVTVYVSQAELVLESQRELSKRMRG